MKRDGYVQLFCSLRINYINPVGIWWNGKVTIPMQFYILEADRPIANDQVVWMQDWYPQEKNNPDEATVQVPVRINPGDGRTSQFLISQ